MGVGVTETLTSAEQFRKFTSSPAIRSAKYFFDYLLNEDISILGNFISKISTGKTPPKSQKEYYDSCDIGWFKSNDIGNGVYLDSAGDYISNISVDDKKSTFFEKGTLLITCIGDIGRIGILKENASANQQITGILTNEYLSPEFAYLYLVSHRENFINSDVLKTTLPIINQKKIHTLPIKTPSLSMQQAVVKLYFHYIKTGLLGKFPSELNCYKDKLIAFDKLVSSSSYFSKKIKSELANQQTLLKKLRQQILQEAIEGKLTADWRQENKLSPSQGGLPCSGEGVEKLTSLSKYEFEPASELLKRIQAEKEQLIKDKKIKPQKPLPSITEAEKPFALPNGWVWCRLGEITIINPRNTVADDIEIGFTPMRLVSNNLYIYPKYEPKIWRSVKKGFTHFANNDVIIAKITPCFENSKAGIIKEFPNGIGAGTTELHVVRTFIHELKSDYIYLLVKTTNFLKSGKKLMTGSAGQKRVPKDYIESLPFSLPPSPEQKAIVAKVEKLLALCAQMEIQITTNQAHAKALMQSVLKEAFMQPNNDSNKPLQKMALKL